MPISYPYAQDFLQDLLDISELTFDLQRFDEEAGTGDGRFWATEMARPLWVAELSLIRIEWEDARRINARVRALQGSAKELLFTDPTYQPAFDPGAAVTVSAINATRDTIALSGLPAFHSMRDGDQISIAWGAGNTRRYLAEISGEYEANGSGVMSGISVYPFLPLGITNGAAVEARAPQCKMFVAKDGFQPYGFTSANLSTTATLKLMQRP